MCLLAAAVGFSQKGSGRLTVSFGDPWDGRCDSVDVFLTPSTPSLPLLSPLSPPSLPPLYPLSAPSLPSACRLFTLPRGSRATLNEWHASATDTIPIAPYSLAPAPGPTWKDRPSTPPLPDPKAYAADRFLSAVDHSVALQHLGTMGDKELYRLTASPFEYNPKRQILLYRHNLEATIEYSLADAPCSSLPEPQGLLIVSRPEFRTALQPFVQWKRQEGYLVSELYSDSRQRDTVKEAMRPWFDSGDPTRRPPRYVLLVGDAEQFQSFVGYSRPEGISPHPTDLYYGDFTGDYLPEAIVGRWTVSDTAELRAVVLKTLRYEQGIGLDADALSRTLLVAGNESTIPAPTTTNGQVYYVSHTVAATRPALDTVCFYNPASAAARDLIVSHIGDGAAFLNYTAHCTSAGWTSPSVSFATLDTVPERQPMFYINNCCRSNDFSGTCFGEELLRKPLGGAIAAIGATNSTLWNEDYYWSVGPKYPFSLTPQYDSLRPGAFDRWLRDGACSTAGEILVAGNLAVSAFGSPYDRFYWEIYCLLGDPTLRPRTAPPANAALSVPTPPNGATELLVHGTPGATVTAVQDSVLLAVATVGANGSATLRLLRALDTTPLLVTASGTDLVARTVVVAPTAGLARGIALRHVAPTDSSVTCTVENIGLSTVDSVVVRLSQSPADLAQGATLADASLSVDSLRPGQSLSLSLPLAVVAVGRLPFWAASLSAAAADSTLCSVPVSHSLSVPYPSADFDLLAADSLPVRSLAADSSFLLLVATSGLCDSLALLVSASPSGIVLADTVLTAVSPAHYLPLRTPDSLSHLHLSASLSLGAYSARYDYWLGTGRCVESFEQGTLPAPWRTEGTAAWTLDSSNTHSGLYSMRSGAIDYRQTSDLVLDLLLPHDDSVSFWAKTSSEPEYDRLLFYVDGVLRMDYWGETRWKRYAYRLPAGHHSLRWRYLKDDTHSQGLDCAWLDDVSLPLALWAEAYECVPALGPGIGVSPVDSCATPLSANPNPAAGRLVVDCPAGTTTLLLTDLYGRTVGLWTVTSSRCSLDLSPFPSGLYLLRSLGEAGSSHTRIVIQH